MPIVPAQPSGSLWYDGQGKPISTSGTFQPFCQLTFFLSKTDIPADVYTDGNLTTPFPQPIQADSGGRFPPIYMDPGKAYRYKLVTAALQQLEDVDPFLPSANLNALINDLSAGVVGQIFYPQSAQEFAAGVTPNAYQYYYGDLRRYGADPTGTQGSDTAMLSAIQVFQQPNQGGGFGGKIIVGAGHYIFNAPIILDNCIGIIIEGDAGETGGAGPASRISCNFAGSASAVFISMLSSTGCQLRRLYIDQTNTAWFGKYIKCGNSTLAGATDPVFCGTFDCTIGSTKNGSGNIHLDLDKGQNWSSERCNFIGGNPSVTGAAASSYSNVMNFYKCHFYQSYQAPIDGMGQSWVFDNCTFEELITGGAGGFLGTTAAGFRVAVGCSIRNCWFGDVSSTSPAGTWIDGCFQACSITGNYITGNSTSNNTTGIICRQCSGLTIEDNNFVALLVGVNFSNDGNNSGMHVGPNVANNVGTFYTGTSNVALGHLHFEIGFGTGIPLGHGGSGTNGYRIGYDGIITQWGFVNPAVHGNNTVTFPISFPSACWNVQCTLGISSSTAATIYALSPTTSGFTAAITDGVATSDTFYWYATGV